MVGAIRINYIVAVTVRIPDSVVVIAAPDHGPHQHQLGYCHLKIFISKLSTKQIMTKRVLCLLRNSTFLSMKRAIILSNMEYFRLGDANISFFFNFKLSTPLLPVIIIVLYSLAIV